MRVYNRAKKEFMEVSKDYDKIIKFCNGADRCLACVYYIDGECKACIHEKHNVIYPFEIEIV